MLTNSVPSLPAYLHRCEALSIIGFIILAEGPRIEFCANCSFIQDTLPLSAIYFAFHISLLVYCNKLQFCLNNFMLCNRKASIMHG